MRIFGNLLPFLGFKTLPVDNDGDPTNVLDAHYEADFLCIEWLDEGFTLFSLPPRERPRG